MSSQFDLIDNSSQEKLDSLQILSFLG